MGKSVNGVCVFDIDGTFTYSNIPLSDRRRKNNAMIDSMRECKKLGFAIAINTARPPQEDMLWGIPRPVRKQLESANPSIHFRPSQEKNVELRKYKNMKNIANIFNVPVEKTILVDDIRSNCNYLNARNVSCVEVYDKNGVDNKDFVELQSKMYDILNN